MTDDLCSMFEDSLSLEHAKKTPTFLAEKTRRQNNGLKKLEKYICIDFDHAQHRNNVISKFECILLDASYARKFERACFNWNIDFCKAYSIDRSWSCLQFRKIYNSKVRNMLFHISDSRNTKLFEKIRNKTIKISSLVELSPHEIFPELRQPLIDKKLNKELKNFLWDQEMSSGTGMFKCIRCNSSRTSYYSMQTRSADEPMTNFIKCHACDKHWKD